MRSTSVAPVVSLSVCCLVGPTASGKTEVALALAERLAREGRSLEIISLDSALVYRGMDIGTAKPTPAQRAAVRHHLIDILDPSQAYSAARFSTDCTALVSEIAARGAVPLVVGGTMLYLKALRDGLHAMPAANGDVRQAIDEEAAVRGWPALHAELACVDPDTAQRLAPNDAQRIQRALEIWRSSGRTMTDWQREVRPDTTTVVAGPVVSLEPASRAWLHDRIQRRWDRMVEDGFVDEVLRLRRRQDLHLGLPSVRCVGYRQLWQALDAAGSTALDLTAAAHWRPSAVAATRQLAKRQLTWLRSISDRQVVACDAPQATEQAVGLLYRLLLPQAMQTA
jgi:tRNA dimethylallyltransferase